MEALKTRGRILGALCLLAGAALAGGAPALARQGDARTELAAGTTAVRAGDDTTTGTVVSVGWGIEIQEGVLWSISAAHANTDGEREVNGQTAPLSAMVTSVQTGLTHFFTPGSTLVPFTGGGLSVAAYDIDHSYPTSDIGKTSGTGGGVFARLGVEVRVNPRFTLIPEYSLSIHSIRSDQGDTRSLVSGGLVLALRFST